MMSFAYDRYLPEGMAAPGFYRPVERGLEIKIAEKLRQLRALNQAQPAAGRSGAGL